MALVPLGTAFTFPCVTSLLSQVVPQHERGLYMGVQQTFGGVARVLAPLSAGFAYDHIGHTVPFFAAGVIVAVHDPARVRNGAVREAALRRRRRPQLPETGSAAPGSLSRTAFAISTIGFERSWLERWRMR